MTDRESHGAQRAPARAWLALQHQRSAGGRILLADRYACANDPALCTHDEWLGGTGPPEPEVMVRHGHLSARVQRPCKAIYRKLIVHNKKKRRLLQLYYKKMRWGLKTNADCPSCPPALLPVRARPSTPHMY